ncbi:MAG: hypothetical protein WAT19_12330 [Ferruginibacter sp.]
MKKILPLLLFWFFINQTQLVAQNVGVGTLSPAFKLHVYEPSFPYVGFQNNATGTTGADGSFLGGFQRHLIFYNREAGGNLQFYTDATQRMTLDSLGRLGIGHLPSYMLDVKGDVRIESPSNSTGADLRFFGGATATSLIAFYKDLTNPQLGATLGYVPASDYFYVSNGTGAYFTPTGLGISTTSPVSKFHVVNGQDAGLGNTTNGFAMFGAGNSINVVVDNNEILARNNSLASDLFIQNDAGGVIMCAAEQGAVGIGVNSSASIPAGYLLAVDGKIISEELKVQLSGNWPDYVFKNGYKLKSFDELRGFIAQNNHLPNIPAAAEVEKNGIEVGDMQKRMMEKIEELTLYVLELETRIKAMEKNKAVQQ